MVCEVTVNWNKADYKVTCDPSLGVQNLKEQLQALTGVPANRARLMPKTKGLWKGVLKDTEGEFVLLLSVGLLLGMCCITKT